MNKIFDLISTKNINPKPEFVNYVPINSWTEVEYINVESINDRCDRYNNVKIRRAVVNGCLVIKQSGKLIFHNLEHVIRFYFKEREKKE